jgi:hypothetical protein
MLENDTTLSRKSQGKHANENESYDLVLEPWVKTLHVTTDGTQMVAEKVDIGENRCALRGEFNGFPFRPNL